jgi:uncharacterized protein (DUF885 family)
MRKIIGLLAVVMGLASCRQSPPQAREKNADTDSLFHAFVQRYMDALWKQYPSTAIGMGYFKYADELKIPDSAEFADDIRFTRSYLDSLHVMEFDKLNENNRIDYLMLQNDLYGTLWYLDTFKLQEWNPAMYNLGGDCYEIISKQFAPIEKRLVVLSHHLQHAAAYYQAALANLRQPTREHTELAIQQNLGSLQIFDQSLQDSITASSLTEWQKDSLRHHIEATQAAINSYVTDLKQLLADKNYSFRGFRIGEQNFERKFHYDIVSDFTPKQIFDKAVAAKKNYHNEMFRLSTELWPKYFGSEALPADTLTRIKMMIAKISERHVTPEQLFDTIRQQVRELQKFVVDKQLLSLDSSQKIVVRKMPAYMSGTSLASASSPGPYEPHSDFYYNVSDLTAIPGKKALSQLREQNYYILQILSIHEAVPGHLVQLEYANRSPSIVKSVFGNGAMIEGWAVYSQRMMLENGWGNHAPEMWLMFYKWSMRECCNVIIDYGLQCLNYSKDDVVTLLRNEAFQEEAQIEEKYHRATISQVQLCSYFTGSTEILALRDAMMKKEGDQFNLKNFHEIFLSYGSAPVKYIGQLMLGGN